MYMKPDEIAKRRASKLSLGEKTHDNAAATNNESTLTAAVIGAQTCFSDSIEVDDLCSQPRPIPAGTDMYI